MGPSDVILLLLKDSTKEVIIKQEWQRGLRAASRQYRRMNEYSVLVTEVDGS